LYSLKDLDGEKLYGRFYAEEIQQVAKPEENIYKIEAVLGSRRRAGKQQVLVCVGVVFQPNSIRG